jgi:hypothetical protein
MATVVRVEVEGTRRLKEGNAWGVGTIARMAMEAVVD